MKKLVFIFFIIIIVSVESFGQAFTTNNTTLDSLVVSSRFISTKDTSSPYVLTSLNEKYKTHGSGIYGMGRAINFSVKIIL
jgi:hypothetical protein